MFVIYKTGQFLPPGSTTPNPVTREGCGANEWCYYVDLYPQSGITTSETVDIYTDVESVATTHQVFIKSNSQDCLNPSIDVIYEEIDFRSNFEYFEVYEDNTFITRCNGNFDGACGVYSTCLADYDLNIQQINEDDTYQMTIRGSTGLNDLCLFANGTLASDNALNVKLTITCSSCVSIQMY